MIITFIITIIKEYNRGEVNIMVLFFFGIIQRIVVSSRGWGRLRFKQKAHKIAGGAR